MKAANIFEAIPRNVPREIFDEIITAPGLRIERIVSRGQSSPAAGWYKQERAEWVMVLRGAARLAFEDGGEVVLGPGDYLHIAPLRRHRVTWTDPQQETVWLAVHYRCE